MSAMPRKRGPPTALRIDTPALNPLIVPAPSDSSASALSFDSEYSPFHTVPKARNMKRLSLSIPSAQSSSNSLQLPPSEPQSAVSPGPRQLERPRRPSIISLPSTAAPSALLGRSEEGASPTVPYFDGPIQIIPGVWLGSEDNARDWKGLLERGIKSILNVAKEVASPFDGALTQPLRPFSSTPNLKTSSKASNSTFYPAHLASGRPSMHYLKLQWSHGQQNLVEQGFPIAMNFVDAALGRGEGVLIHCQCGISRSATMAIALVMRAAAVSSTSVPPEVWELKGMQGAYSYVKEKSKWVGPNMSLIYQLLDYERTLKGGAHASSPTASDRSSAAEEEEEWGRRRRMLDEVPSDPEVDEQESVIIMREAQALDKAMEERVIARKASTSSIGSSGVGMGAAWRSRYSNRKRTPSIASNMTNGSIISENLVEEEEEQELLGVGGGFDDESLRRRSVSSTDPDPSPVLNTPEDKETVSPPDDIFTPVTARPRPAQPPSAPVWKTSFSFPSPQPPVTAIRSTFDFSSRSMATPKPKRRPPPLGVLPPVPSSPVNVVTSEAPPKATSEKVASTPPRKRTESRKPAPPPLHLRNTLKPVNLKPAAISTPSQTLFVFPPSPTLTTRTPSTMTLMSNPSGPVPFPTLSTPRVSTFRHGGRTKSFIGIGAPATPTTASSRVDVRGWVGLQ